MAGTAFEVNTSTMKNDISSIDAEIKGLKKDVQQLRNTTQQLSTMWEGNAKNAFVSAVSADISRLEALIDAVSKFNSKADAARNEYEKCEGTVDGIIASIKI